MLYPNEVRRGQASANDVRAIDFLEGKIALNAMRINRGMGNRLAIMDHYHATYEVFLVLSGRVDFGARGRRVPLEPGDLCLIPPLLYHLAERPGPDVDVVTVRFRLFPAGDGECPLDFERLMAEATDDCRDVCVLRGQRSLVSLQNALEAEHREARPFAGAMLDALYAQFFLRMARALQARSGRPDAREPLPRGGAELDKFVLMNEILRAFSANYMRAYTLEELAQQFSFSVSHMQRLIREMYGKSFRELLMETRMLAARKMLYGTDRRVSEIAVLCGYGAYEPFCKSFRHAIGMTPSAYRRAMRGDGTP